MAQEKNIFTPGVEEKIDDQLIRALPVYSGSDVSQNITRTEVLDFGNEGFLLKNVLSREECEHYIKESELLRYEEMPGVKKSYRNNTRVLIKNEDLSQIIFSRIKPHLEQIEIHGDPHKIHIHGIESLLQGTWKPVGLNPTWRFCKYSPGGHFAPHFDGHYAEGSRVRSLKTFMLYLNGDFQGGSTNFVDEEQTLYKDDQERYRAEEKNILIKLQPEEGLAIVFNHHRLHEGSPLLDGIKYIMRTDVMYEKEGTEAIDPQEEAALAVVQEAERQEARGNNMAAMELYRKAFKMSSSLAASYGN